MPVASLRPLSGSLPAFLARRLALLALTLVLVPSLSFVMFTLIQGEHTAPLDVLRELGSYLAAVILQGDVGEGTFRNQTFIRTQGALEIVRDGFLVDVYLLAGAIGFAVLAGLTAGMFQARHPRSPASRAITGLTALGLASPVYFVGLMLLLLFAPGSGAVAEVPFLSGVAGYRAPSADLGRVRAPHLDALRDHRRAARGRLHAHDRRPARARRCTRTSCAPRARRACGSGASSGATRSRRPPRRCSPSSGST